MGVWEPASTSLRILEEGMLEVTDDGQIASTKSLSAWFANSLNSVEEVMDRFVVQNDKKYEGPARLICRFLRAFAAGDAFALD